MTTTDTADLANLPAAPPALGRLFDAADDLRSTRAVLIALSGDNDASVAFLRLARMMLPGRRLMNPGEAAPLLGETVSMRLALLASGVHWLRRLARESHLAVPLLRHSVACAVAAEPLGRDSGIVDPLHAFSLGLLHHVGEAGLHGIDYRDDDVPAHEVGADLLRAAGAPEAIVNAVLEYGRAAHGVRAPLSIETRILAAADHAVTGFGYAAPQSYQSPCAGDRVCELTSNLFASTRRICSSIEDVLGCAVEQHLQPVQIITDVGKLAPLSTVVLPEAMDGVSTRDLGPLPVLFSRIAGASDAESIIAALTAGLVEELGMDRAYFLNMEDGKYLRGGILSCRGNVPLPVHDFVLHVDQLPRHLKLGLVTGRPILNGDEIPGLEFLRGHPEALCFYVPVLAGKEVMGLIGAEVADSRGVLPDLMAAIATHSGLALKAVALKRLSDEAKIDELTGLYNRRGILDALDSCLENAISRGEEIAIALIDCDHLKKVNDNFGHLMGDEFVRRISEVVKLSLRSTDMLGRYGGDEFLAVLPGADYEMTFRAMERARQRVEAAGLDSEDGLLLSISVGAVVRGQSGASRETLLKIADHSLYRAKEVGRNAVRVTIAGADADEQASL